MRRLLAGISLAILVLFGAAATAFASPVPPPGDYGPGITTQVVAMGPLSPVPPPGDY